MRKSFELEDSFRNLNQIPRSEIQKRKTYNNILQTGKPERQLHYIVKTWTGNFLTFVMILACAAFLFTEVQTPAYDGETALKPAQFLAASVPVITYLAKSDSADQFNLNFNLTRKGVTIIDEPSWMETVNKTLSGQSSGKDAASPDEAYDVLVVYENRKPDKCKLWIDGDTVYIKKMKGQLVYKIEKEKSEKVIAMIRDMEKQVQF
ncbi:hypothetical protein J7E38_04790 [Bacillus sp. ISL-35]|uniref:hypothetical protein n=1 Tax=Bacillus sp. ISL-35 TaxID=2819122 RepID=UPI001BE8F1F2|nr:hypothetical protein [Bacillus sp. ISL-35]MBT2678305.1 hypothetical protein [Bacillus sp. ISL-35]MBT2705971.1 hypothetical protein [Chryseobacterium sp. ISL-80]